LHGLVASACQPASTPPELCHTHVAHDVPKQQNEPQAGIEQVL